MLPYRRRKAVRRAFSKRNQGLLLLATRSIAVRIKVDLGIRAKDVQRHIRLNRRTNTNITGTRRLVKAEALRPPRFNVFRRQRLQGIENRVVLVTHPILLVLRKTINLKRTVVLRNRLKRPVLTCRVVRNRNDHLEGCTHVLTHGGEDAHIVPGAIKDLGIAAVFERPHLIHAHARRFDFTVRGELVGRTRIRCALIRDLNEILAANRIDILVTGLRHRLQARYLRQGPACKRNIVRRIERVSIMILMIAPVLAGEITIDVVFGPRQRHRRAFMAADTQGAVRHA